MVVLGLRRSPACAVDEADPLAYCICTLPYSLIYGWLFPGRVRYPERTPGVVTGCARPGIGLHKFIRLHIRCMYTLVYILRYPMLYIYIPLYIYMFLWW